MVEPMQLVLDTHSKNMPDKHFVNSMPSDKLYIKTRFSKSGEMFHNPIMLGMAATNSCCEKVNY